MDVTSLFVWPFREVDYYGSPWHRFPPPNLLAASAIWKRCTLRLQAEGTKRTKGTERDADGETQLH